MLAPQATNLSLSLLNWIPLPQVFIHERDNEHNNLLKLLVIMVGFGLIGALRLMDDHSHALPPSVAPHNASHWSHSHEHR